MAEIGVGTGLLGCFLQSGINSLYPNFREVKSIYISEDNETLMINTQLSTVFVKGLQRVDAPSFSSNQKED